MPISALVGIGLHRVRRPANVGQVGTGPPGRPARRRPRAPSTTGPPNQGSTPAAHASVSSLINVTVSGQEITTKRTPPGHRKGLVLDVKDTRAEARDNRRGRDQDAARLRLETRYLPGREPGERQARRGGHAPDEPRRQVAGRPAVDRPPREAL